MKLHRVNRPRGHNRFCGPAAISAVTGMTTGDAAALIRKVNGKHSVMGTYTWEVLEALKRCGIHALRKTIKPKSTLAQWLKATVKDRTAGRVFLISAGRHWQVISGRRYVCGISKDIISIRDKGCRKRARVKEVFELITNGITLPVETKTKKADPEAKIRRECKSLAAMIGAEIEKERGDYLIRVWPPEYVDEDFDPYVDDHSHGTWAQALDAVKTYAEMPRT